MLKADVHEVKLLKDKKRSGPGKFFWAMSQVPGNKRPAVNPFEAKPENYDLVILGTPVWAGKPAPVFLSFLDRAKFSGRKIAVFCCHGGGQGNALEKLKTALAGNTIISENNFVSRAKTNPDELMEKVRQWTKTLGV